MINMTHVENYGDVFSRILKDEINNPTTARFDLLDRVKEHYSAHDDSPFLSVAELFPGKDNVWLSKELDKWKRKLSNNVFKPTLQNLYIFSLLTDATPNDILLSDKPLFSSGKIVFLPLSSLESLIRYLQEENELSQNYVLPISFAPQAMVASFLSIYKQTINNIPGTYMQFLLSSVEQCQMTTGVEKPQVLGGFTSVACTDPREIRITGNAVAVKKMSIAYKQMENEFNLALSDLQNYLIEDLYSDLENWLVRLDPDSCPLVKYYPVPAAKTQENRSTSLDSLINKARSPKDN